MSFLLCYLIPQNDKIFIPLKLKCRNEYYMSQVNTLSFLLFLFHKQYVLPHYTNTG